MRTVTLPADGQCQGHTLLTSWRIRRLYTIILRSRVLVWLCGESGRTRQDLCHRFIELNRYDTLFRSHIRVVGRRSVIVVATGGLLLISVGGGSYSRALNTIFVLVHPFGCVGGITSFGHPWRWHRLIGRLRARVAG